ncbi:MAG TPA: hypothetical protein VMS32_03940 [Verrucomicrobiae bacterium]|jgi:uncharacterized membrane protein|nr:hypothetical protein [Verrucomicrobiae bacterium]
MASQVPTPTDTPFGMQASVAAGLAYVFGIVGGIVMLVGGGTNQFVKWAAAQSIVIFVVFYVIQFVLGFFLFSMWSIIWPLLSLVRLVWFAVVLWTAISAFMGKEVRVPVIADLTTRFFPQKA